MLETPWGYSVDAETMPPLITVADFDTLTGGAFSSSSEKVEAAIEAASASVRDYCGWHVSPALTCEYTGEGEGRIFVLPAMGVSNVEYLKIANVSRLFQWKTNGLVRLSEGYFPDDWRAVECRYTAGFDSASIGAVVAQIVANSLAASPGVSDERAGNVSITYNRTGDGITGGISLLGRDKEQLAPYKLVRAW